MIINTTHSLQGEDDSRDMRESQRALELRKFFAPHRHDNYKSDSESDLNDSLNNDGALDAYAETVVWRLKGVHAMVSLIDRGTQYFLAGALRTCVVNEDDSHDVLTVGGWFGCSDIPTPGGLCEHTLELDITKDDYPCFIINDLTKDERFAHLPVVAGSPHYRFYVGTPITTNHGVNIGSLFLFDNKARAGLSRSHRKFLHKQAGNVMKHLETKREAAERRRVALMSKGIARFLERTSHEIDASEDTFDHSEEEIQDGNMHREKDTTNHPQGRQEVQARSGKASTSVLDKIRTAMDHAAGILRESLELTVGGVVFLDTAAGYMDNSPEPPRLDPSPPFSSGVHDLGAEELHYGNSHSLAVFPRDQNANRHLLQRSTRSSTDIEKVSKVLAMSTAGTAIWDSNSISLSRKSLESLINSYPKGNVWYIDDEGYFSSLEQIHMLQEIAGTSPSGRRRSFSPLNLTKQRAEAVMLSRMFHNARQIIFLPLWDAGGDRWYSGCFVWSQSATPVFTVDSEISYLSAFTNSVMVEISRLDAITSNKMKSDFISSISHEFRSPLHGILSCTEFLRDSDLNTSQTEFISTIQNCSGTLLDTINHVLDYSKINSFEKAGNKQGTISNELYQDTNLALLCEDIINGMIAANEFRGAGSSDVAIPVMDDRSPKVCRDSNEVEIILDLEYRDWEYKIQPGALRRVVMNLFGNAQKYTKKGSIMVRLQIQNNPFFKGENPNTPGDIMVLHIRDTGKGMSSEYMERKLYHPFAQEDSFATGVGLGLSIVWSIVNQLGGKISIGSELNKGTDVEVTIPVEMANGLDNTSFPFGISQVSTEAQACIPTLRNRAIGKSVWLRQTNKVSRDKNLSWKCIERYCTEWFGFTVKDGSADIVITDEEDLNEDTHLQYLLLVHKNMALPENRNNWLRNYAFGSISEPVGPFKLARSILALLGQPVPISAQRKLRNDSADVATQTPLGSPEERTIMDGIIMTDYGFTPQTTLSSTPITQGSSSPETKAPLPGKIFDASRVDRGWDDVAFANIQAFAELKLPTARPNSPSITSFSKSTQKEQSMAEVLPHLPATPASVKGLNILAVDDNVLNLQLLHRYLLKRKSDKIVTASNGLEAVEAVRKADCRFDVIFMDISMPEMDGFEATGLIRNYERSPETQLSLEEAKSTVVGDDKPAAEENESPTVVPMAQNGAARNNAQAYIVALTGLASRRDREKAKESGFDDFLTKPISFRKIGELLKRLSEEPDDAHI